MFKVLKDLRGVGDVHAEGCYWLSVFDIDILEDLCFCFVFLFAFLRVFFYVFDLPFVIITGTTSISAFEFCMLA